MSESAGHDTTTGLPGPPSQDVINLAGADIAISTVFLFLSAWIAWKHGKQGMVAWPIFASCFIARLIGAIYQIVKRDKPEIPNAVTTFIGGTVLACMSLTIFGVVYECNIILPTPPRRKREKIILGLLHLINTAGVALSMYGGAPKAGGVISPVMDKLGNALMLLALAATGAWMVPTARRARRYACLGHPNAAPARRMLAATLVAMAPWLVRLAHGAVYAFHRDTAALDPVMGSFQTKLVLLFGAWLGASAALAAAGWLGRDALPAPPGGGGGGTGPGALPSFADPEAALRTERRRTLGELRREHRRWLSESRAAGAVDDAELSTMLVGPGAKPDKEPSRFRVLRRMSNTLSSFGS